MKVSLLMFLLLIPALSLAQTVTLAWDAVTTNVDGTPVTDLAGYRVYMAYTSIADDAPKIDAVADVPADQMTAVADVGPLPSPGATVYFRATAYDTSGNESGYSNEVSRDFLAPHTLIIRFE